MTSPCNTAMVIILNLSKRTQIFSHLWKPLISIGWGHAKRLVLQGETIRAEKAQDLGIVDIITEDIPNAIQASVQRFQPLHPITVQLARRLLNESFHDSYEDAIGHFLAAQQRAISQDCFSETIKKKQEK